ncbi:mating-type protein beta 1-domain-containing protein [Crepidotus variabilis]|uniref:Mating-type protein beta 1-domain-containing protein n=1 Tax=Crepidotus variabilis TaxID=179855 RepID=A0A9P6JVN7_9AGAR|nr:mating-type protein beta 1-domain-containing protein [Crepidotus variabilis]
MPPSHFSSSQNGVSVDSEIQLSIEALHNDFFLGIGGDESGLISFIDAWGSLCDKIESTRDLLQPETLQQAYTLSEIVKAVTSSMLELETDIDTFTNDFSTDVTKLFADLALVEPCGNSTTGNVSDTTSTLPHISAAYEWLMSNLHNPYPSKEVRSQIALSNGVSRKIVDSWFVDARKRIGWNKFCKLHFNSRKEMVDAATTFFSGIPMASTSNEPAKVSPSSEELSFIFISLETRAKNLYSNEHGEYTDFDSEISHRGRKRSASADVQLAKRKYCRSSSAYPSPPASIQGSPGPALLSRDSSHVREGSTSPSNFDGLSCHYPMPHTVTSHVSQPLFSKRKRDDSCPETLDVPLSKRARRTVSAPSQSNDNVLTPVLNTWPTSLHVENFDFSVDMPPAVTTVRLAQNIEWDATSFEQIIASLQREDTPALSEAGSSPSITSPSLADSPALEYSSNLDFTTYHDPANQALLSVESEPLIFYNGYNNTPDASTDLFSTLLQPSEQYDMSLAPLDIIPNSWLSPLDQDNLNSWSLPATDKGLLSMGGQTPFYQPAIPTLDERMAKLLRAQQLREELRKLEQDIQA